MKKNKILLLIVSLLILTSCGFKALNQKGENIIFFNNIEVVGDPRITSFIKNNIAIISNEKSANKYDAKLEVKKKKNVKIKDKTGKTTRYTLSLILNLELVDIQKNKIQKTFTQNEDYEIASVHSTSIENENSAIKIIIERLSEDIINFLTLTMRNK